jgi:TPP-dependent pyruvate/acetoin dehydrogenase alpha subunit
VIRHTYQGSGYGGWKTGLEAFDKDVLTKFYLDMLRIRRIEEAIESKYHEDQMKTPIHLVIGMEAISVGSCGAMTKEDLIYCGHRTHGHYLGKGGDFRKMLSEFFCRSNGCVGSRGGSMHLMDKTVGMAGSSAIVGGAVPIAVGAALAAQMKGEDRVVTVYFGDAATEEGVLWESLNFAALKKLPIIFFCENNFYSVCSPLEYRQPNVEIYEKAESFGIPAVKIDGTNVLDVYDATRQAVVNARNGGGATFIEAQAYRWRGHGGAGDDSKTGYRDIAEVLEWQKYCPIVMYGEFLKSQGILSDDTIGRMENEIQDEIRDAFAFAVSSPNPVESDLYQHVYSD